MVLKWKKTIAVFLTLVLLVFSLPVSSFAAVVSPDDLVGRWQRFGDGAEGTIVKVAKVANSYQATLEKATGTLVDLGFAAGDLKWKDVKSTGSGNYSGMDMFRYQDGGYEYRNSKLQIDSSGILKVYVAASAGTEVIIGVNQTWQKLADPVIVPVPVVDKPSAWAVAEINNAINYGLTTPKVLKNYQGNITREEFAEIAVRLYEKLTASTAQPIQTNPFKDTSNVEVLKAYNLGIITGISTTEFAPNSPATREQICSMLLRTIKKARTSFVVDISGVKVFADSKSISPYALEAVKQMNKLEIVKGSGENILPKNFASREQVILMIVRVYVAFR
ncbi:MAG: S-layer homology domain-containing protein [Clostridia bacterium]